MIALLSVTAALANPLALRTPTTGPTAVVGAPMVGVGAWLSPELGVAVHLRQLGSLQLDAATRLPLRQRAWTTELQLHGGLVAPLIDPDLGLAAGLALRQERIGERIGAGFSLVAPLSTTFRAGDWRLAPTLETALTLRLGPVRVGVQGGLGLVVGDPRRGEGQLGLILGLEPTVSD